MLRALRYVVLCLPLLTAGAAVAGPTQSAGSAQADNTVTATTFVVRGRGWGHGVGMCQWGAYGQARRGVSYKKILAHYYRGTKLVETETSSVRILLADGRQKVTVGSEVPFRLLDGKGEIHELEPGSYSMSPTFKVALDPGLPRRALPGPLIFLHGAEPLDLEGRLYRGNLQLRRIDGRLQVVNVVGVDPYIRGVVSEEVPEDWPLEAVKAQAVAARSYALAQSGERSAILYADTRSQVYGGVEAESDVGDAAVAGTKRQILTYDGNVANTFFFSSSGGRTANVEDVFGGGTPIPYLVSVPDPDDKWSPHHRWGPVVLPATRLSKLFRAPGTWDARTVPASGRAKEIVLTTKTGERRLSSTTVRRSLDLRSTWMTIGVLALSRPAGMATAGMPLTLTGTARQVKGPIELQSKVGGGAWTDGLAVDLAADRSFAIDVVPEATTQYRLTAADDVVSVPLRVPVAAGKPRAGGRQPASQRRGPRRAVVLRQRSARRAPVASGVRSRVRLLGRAAVPRSRHRRRHRHRHRSRPPGSGGQRRLPRRASSAARPTTRSAMERSWQA